MLHPNSIIPMHPIIQIQTSTRLQWLRKKQRREMSQQIMVELTASSYNQEHDGQLQSLEYLAMHIFEIS